MLKASAALAACLVVCLQSAHADGAQHRFDGEWDTIVSCPNSSGALGYSFEFSSRVKDGVLHGEKGSRGERGWLALDGTIRDDGTASLYASGLVGAADFAVGHLPAGSAYGYHVDAHFAADSGEGRRLEGRPCTVTFKRIRNP